jgi:two-component system cell cycle sensor histidine kinase/response regulator CckA
VLPPDRAFAGSTHIAEQIFRLARASQQGRSLKEDFRIPALGEAEDEAGIVPRWFRISVRPMPVDPRSGRNGSLVVWQVEEITQDRASEESSFERVQSAIAYLDNAPAGFFARPRTAPSISQCDACAMAWPRPRRDRRPAAKTLGDHVVG